MKHIFTLSLFFYALSLSVCAQVADARGYIVQVGDALPALNLTLTDGRQVTPDDL